MKMIAAVALISSMATLLLVTTVGAQDVSSLLSQAQSVGNTMISDILSGIQTTNTTSARSDAQAAVTAGKQWESLLGEALTLAPDDATRSAISGILAHVTAATNSAQLAVSGSDAEVQSRLDAARGEAQEAMGELKPLAARFPAAAPAPVTALPSAGGLEGTWLLVAGLALLTMGIGIRRLGLAS